MREGSLEAPERQPLGWRDPAFYDEAALDAELRRVFDICHGCRRCFNLCDSFPRLFDLIDESESGELDTVASSGFKTVADACTLCDMCFLTKCPYVPPHAFNLDFPQLMLRYRAGELERGEVPTIQRQITDTDRNGTLARLAAPVANWALDRGNTTARRLLQTATGIHADAVLPPYESRTFTVRAASEPVEPNPAAPAFGRKAALYATCFVNYNTPSIGEAALKVLRHNGVEVKVVYPKCCGMPRLEQGDVAGVAAATKSIAEELRPLVDDGYAIVSLVPSCTLMLKGQAPLLSPEDEDVRIVAGATHDIDAYMVDIARTEGLAEGLMSVEGGIVLHHACHSRAQNIGRKSAEMLRAIPGADVQVIERCSGHGGSWGMMEGNFETALKVGRPAARQALGSGKAFVASACPLAGAHIVQGMDRLAQGGLPTAEHAHHPIEILAKAYGF